MVYNSLLVIICLTESVLAALTCTDWKLNSISDGQRFYPKENDPCFSCQCDKGDHILCKSVSCAPPSNCQKYTLIPGLCCQFECVNPGFVSPGENSTGIPGTDVQGTPTDSTMTDLGLRLVASTVTTFLILALLLFLIHRLRQRRLLVELRRHNYRRDHYADYPDLDNSFTRQYYECPPYEDPPPPYSPPKPPHIQPGEQPPPYTEVIDTNGNTTTGNMATVTSTTQNQNGNVGNNNNRSRTVLNGVSQGNGSVEGNGNSSSRSSGVIIGNGNMVAGNNGVVGGVGHVTGRNSTLIDGHLRICTNEAERVRRERHSFNGQDGHSCINNSQGVSNVSQRGKTVGKNSINNSALNENGSAQNRNSLSVHFRNSSSGQPSITMGIQTRGRHNRNRYSDGNINMNQNRNLQLSQNAALNLEIRNTILNLRNNSEVQNNRPVSDWVQNQQSFMNNSGDRSSSTTDIGESSTSAESLESSPNFSPVSLVSGEDADATNLKQTQLHGSSENINEAADSTVRQFLDRQFGLAAKNRRYPTTMAQSWSSPLSPTSAASFKQSASVGSFSLKEDKNRAESQNSDGINTPENSQVTTACRRPESLLSRSKSEQLKTNGSLRNPPYKNIVRSQTTSLIQPGYAARVSYVEPDEVSQNASLSNTSQTQTNPAVDSTVSDCSSADLNVSFPSAMDIDPGDIIVTRRQDNDLRELRLSHLLHNARQRYEAPKSLPTSPIKYNGPTQMPVCSSANSMNSSTSVCSETGEKHIACVAIGNDAQYPDNSYRNHQISSVKTGSSPKNSPTHSSQSKNTVTSLQKDSNMVAMSQSWHGNHIEPYEENARTDTLGRNVNSNFDKKTCSDKDMSNLCFPLFKQINNDPEVPRNLVPSSDMRACASQMYNCETEDTSAHNKKYKKRHFLKRHSAGCFPVKKESHDSSIPPKLPLKQKNSRSRDIQLFNKSHEEGRELGSNGQSSTSLKDRKEYGYIDRAVVSNSDEVVTDLTPSCLIQSNHLSPVHLFGSKQFERDTIDIGRVRQSKSDRRRSKSLGRADNHHTSEKIRENSQNRRPSSRKKRTSNRLSFQGELEHVLGNQKVAIKSHLATSGMDKSSGPEHALLCSVTEV